MAKKTTKEGKTFRLPEGIEEAQVPVSLGVGSDGHFFTDDKDGDRAVPESEKAVSCLIALADVVDSEDEVSSDPGSRGSHGKGDKLAQRRARINAKRRQA